MKTKTKAKAAAKKKQPKEVEAVSAPKAAEYERKRTEVETAKLKFAPWNPRPKITPESVADLASSIRSLGVIEPLVAMLDKDGGATLISGHRRLVAAKLAGLEKVPCDILAGVDEAVAQRMTFIENLQRRDADPLLESELVGNLVKSGMKQDEIAAETGRGREWVARRLNLSHLSKSWRQRVKDGEQITTDCLEHVAAYPEKVQERLKGAKTYKNPGAAIRWCDIESQFDRETQDLKKAVFDRTPCKTCPNNTGCSPDLFDWDGKPTAYGKCMDGKCYKRKVAEAVKATIADAKENGVEVRECKQHPDYSISLQSKPDKKHDTLYVWKDWNDETVMQWGERPRTGQTGGGLTDEEKDARKRKLAANKARRKLASWCESNLSGVIMAAYTVDVQIALAFQRVFDIGSSWRVFGSQTNAEVAARTYLLDPSANDFAPMERWAPLAAAEIAAKLVKPVGAKYAELLIAILPPTAGALTDEERQLIAPDERVLKLREPVKVVWASSSTEADDGEDEEPFDDEETED
ncbi:MAG: ParB/RepB/Spo0J family partition protein [Kiritimatiellae bacterium]|nr:ParB/RepB/Spo0J family partition protein [Kiritimatiellia bacterium]